jgi:NADPH:quinone reductase
MTSIRVHQFGEPSVLQLEQLPTPTPGEDQLLIKIEAVGVNPVETYIRKGIYGPRQFPFTPGSDAAGVVAAAGEAVRRFKAGDRVYIYGTLSGAYADHALCAEAQVQHLPAHVSFQQGAAIGIPYATAHRAIHHRARAKAGETVLIHGATGGVGTAATQLARVAGLRIFATGGTAEGRKLAREQGAEHVLDHHDPEYLKQLMELTVGKGVDVILEMLANVNLGKDLTVLAKHGRVVVIGSRGPVEINPRDTMGRDADIRGMTLMNASAGELLAIHDDLLKGLESRALDPIVGQELPLAQAAKAHELVMQASGAHGKIVLIP